MNPLSWESKSRVPNKAKNVAGIVIARDITRDCKAPKKVKGKDKKEIGSYSETSDDDILICCVESETDSWVLDS